MKYLEYAYNLYPSILKIIKYLVGALVFLWLIVFTYLNFIPSSKNCYHAAILQKQKLLEETPSPRIIITGSSSAAFGINSTILHNDFNLPVVNMALDSDLGSSFMLKQLEGHLQPNDIVLLVVDYQTSQKGNLFPQLITGDYLSEARDWRSAFTFSERLNGRLAYYWYISKSFFLSLWDMAHISKESSFSNIYTCQGFDTKGDLVSHLGQPPYIKNSLPALVVDSTLNQQIEEVNSFNRYATQKQAKLFWVIGSCSEGYFEQNQKAVQQYETVLNNTLFCPIIGNSLTGVMDDALYFDSQNHPNAEGRKIWTYRIVELLDSFDF